LHLIAAISAFSVSDESAHSFQKEIAPYLREAYDSPMTVEEVKALPIDCKVQIMETIWEDFRDRFDRLDISQAQRDLLDERRARVRNGAARLLDWDSTKGSVGRA
jgi:hypothetical protein